MLTSLGSAVSMVACIVVAGRVAEEVEEVEGAARLVFEAATALDERVCPIIPQPWSNTVRQSGVSEAETNSVKPGLQSATPAAADFASALDELSAATQVAQLRASLSEHLSGWLRRD